MLKTAAQIILVTVFPHWKVLEFDLI